MSAMMTNSIVIIQFNYEYIGVIWWKILKWDNWLQFLTCYPTYRRNLRYTLILDKMWISNCHIPAHSENFMSRIYWKQAQRRAAADRSRHKSHGRIQYQGPYFPTRCTKWILIILIVLVEKKHTNLIYYMPWLYQYPPLPFYRFYKN